MLPALTALLLTLLSSAAQATPPTRTAEATAERTRLRQELQAGTWVKRERWIPGSKQRCELKAHQLGCALVVRSTVPEARGGQPGLLVRELIKQAPRLDAGLKHDVAEAAVKKAFQQVIKVAQQEFIREAPANKLHACALDGVCKATATDKTSLFRAAMNGVAEGLEDRWTKYFEPVTASQEKVRLQPQQVGCGFTLRVGQAGLTVAGVAPGSPALRAGLRAGDVVTAIDGRAPASLEAASSALKGERGTQVALQVLRDGAATTLQVTRDLYQVFAVQSAVNSRGVGVVRLPKFYDGSARAVREAIDGLERQHGAPLAGVVLDLRDNGGGSRPEWVAILRDFIPQGSLGQNMMRNGEVERFTADGSARHATLPLVVLVNGKSASASERVAGVLKDRGRALIVGEPTYGKDVGQSTHDLADGSSFKLTNIAFHLPSGGRAGVITPDIPGDLAAARVREVMGANAPKDPLMAFAMAKLQPRAASVAAPAPATAPAR